ncbi:hypothetical protein PT2222_100234 [Paraburkholderia tropica]
MARLGRTWEREKTERKKRGRKRGSVFRALSGVARKARKSRNARRGGARQKPDRREIGGRSALLQRGLERRFLCRARGAFARGRRRIGVAIRIGMGIGARALAEFGVEDGGHAAAQILARLRFERAQDLVLDEHRGERTQPPDRLDESRHVGRGRQSAGVVAVEMAHDHFHQHARDGVEMRTRLLQHVEQVARGNAFAHGGRGRVEHGRIARDERQALAFQQAEFGEPREAAGRLRAEQLDQFGQRIGFGPRMRPRTADRVFEAEDRAQIAAVVDGLDEVLDIRERVAAREQVIDELEPRHVRVVVNAHAAALVGRHEQIAVLIGAHVAHRGAGHAREFVDGVLAVVGALGRGIGNGSRGRFRHAPILARAAVLARADVRRNRPAMRLILLQVCACTRNAACMRKRRSELVRDREERNDRVGLEFGAAHAEFGAVGGLDDHG